MSLEQIAENLARALGHTVKCQGQLGYCICGAAKQQAKALDDYEHWKQERAGESCGTELREKKMEERRKGHSKLVVEDGKIVTQRDSEAKQFSQAEVDTLVAAERALFAQRAAERVRSTMQRVCGTSYRNPSEAEDDFYKRVAPNFWEMYQGIISLHDPNALKEHDAALRLTSRLLGIEDSKGMIEQLEAENAGLRDQIATAENRGKNIREEEIKTALRIITEMKSGAALNAVSEDFPWIVEMLSQKK